MQKHSLNSKCLEGAIAPSTARNYRHDIDSFWAWAKVSHLASKPKYPIPLPWLNRYAKELLTGYPTKTLKDLKKIGCRDTGKPLTIGSVRNRLGALSVEHALRSVTNNCRDSSLQLLLRRAARLRSMEPDHRHRPITKDVLETLLGACSSDLRGKRDRALLLVGFAGGGRRRSELAALKVEDLEKVKGGYVASLATHKTVGITGHALSFPILGRASKALDLWLKAAGIESGPAFRGIHRNGHLSGRHLDGKTICRIIKGIAVKAGYPVEMFGAHSLRSGFMTQAAREGIALPEAMSVSGHRSLQIAYRYYRAGNVLENRAARLMGSRTDD